VEPEAVMHRVEGEIAEYQAQGTARLGEFGRRTMPGGIISICGSPILPPLRHWCRRLSPSHSPTSAGRATRAATGPRCASRRHGG
jgi:hypothetical protein